MLGADGGALIVLAGELLQRYQINCISSAWSGGESPELQAVGLGENLLSSACGTYSSARYEIASGISGGGGGLADWMGTSSSPAGSRPGVADVFPTVLQELRSTRSFLRGRRCCEWSTGEHPYMTEGAFYFGNEGAVPHPWFVHVRINVDKITNFNAASKSELGQRGYEFCTVRMICEPLVMLPCYEIMIRHGTGSWRFENWSCWYHISQDDNPQERMREFKFAVDTARVRSVTAGALSERYTCILYTVQYQHLIFPVIQISVAEIFSVCKNYRTLF